MNDEDVKWTVPYPGLVAGSKSVKIQESMYIFLGTWVTFRRNEEVVVTLSMLRCEYTCSIQFRVDPTDNTL